MAQTIKYSPTPTHTLNLKKTAEFVSFSKLIPRVGAVPKELLDDKSKLTRLMLHKLKAASF